MNLSRLPLHRIGVRLAGDDGATALSDLPARFAPGRLPLGWGPACALGGIVLGLAIVVLAMLIEGATSGKAGLPGAALSAQREPLLWVLDGLPLILGGLLWFVGLRMDAMQASARRAARRDAYYRAVTRTLAEGLAIFDAEGRVVDLNLECARLFGVERDRAVGKRPVGHRMVRFPTFGEEHSFRNGRFPTFRTFVDGRPLRNQLIEIRRADGTPAFARVNAAPLSRPGDGERPSRVVVTYTDVTVEVEAQRALEERSQSLRFALDAVDLGSAFYDSRTNQIVWSDRYYQILGLEPGSVTAGPGELLKRIHPEDRPRVLAELREVEERPEFRSQFRVVHPDEAVRVVERRGMALTESGGDRTRVISTLLDVTERVNAERELREEHARSEQLLTAISSLLIGVGADGTVHLWNRVAGELFGLPEDRTIGKPIAGCGVDWDWATLEAIIAESLASGRPRRIDEFPYLPPDGAEAILGLTVNPVVDDRGGGAGYLLVGADITERRNLEVQLAQAQRLESIGRLAAGIAHEINTPAQYVGDNVAFCGEAFERIDRLIDRYRELLAACEEQRVSEELVAAVRASESEADIDFLRAEFGPAIRQSLDGIERVTRIVRAMKEFSHPGSSEKIPTDLNRAIESAVTVARNEWKYVAEIETDFAPDLPYVSVLAGQFNQAILNLIVNAAHAIAEVNAATPENLGRITISTKQDGDWVEIRVSDTGTGIAEEVKPRIFDPFVTTKEVGKGSGQGLAIARSAIVDKHRGTITVDSTPGQGATFTIRLPVEQEQPLAAA